MTKNTIQGKSLPLNIFFILLNLTGLTFLTMGYHKSWEEQSGMFVTLGIVLMIVSASGLLLFKGKLMMASVARIIVGGLMIVSGLVKANDPIGFSYKLEEYFEDGGLAYRIKEWFSSPEFSIEFWIDYALPISIAICILEIVLGVLTLLGGKIKLVSYLMFGMMLFFTALTWHTKSCDKDATFLDRDRYEATDPVGKIKLDLAKSDENISVFSVDEKEIVIDEIKNPQCVDDCGCFGDALKGSVGRSLTPNESFWKDIILLYLVLWIFIAQWTIKPNSKQENVIYFLGGTVVITFFSFVFGWYFPVLFGLIALLLGLWAKQKLGNFWMSTLLVSVLCGAVIFYVMCYAPIKDYRPYAIGNNLKEKMNDGVEAQYEYYYSLTNLKNGQEKIMKMSELPSDVWENPDKWKAELSETKTIVELQNPSIMDFKPLIYIEGMTENEKNLPFIAQKLKASKMEVMKIKSFEYKEIMDVPMEEYDSTMYTKDKYQILDTVQMIDPNLIDLQIDQDIIEQDKIVLLVTKKMDESNWGNLKKIRAIFEVCQKKNVPFIMIANGLQEDLNAFRKKNKFDVPLFLMDEIELKIISRSNPAMLVLEKGIVKAKYSHRVIPSVDKFKSEFLK